MLLGDSHALMWAPVIDEICREEGWTVAIAGMTATTAFFEIPVRENQPGSPFYTPAEKAEFDRARLDALRRWRPRVVILAGRWTYRSSRHERDLLDELDRLGCRVLWIGQPPELGIGNHNTRQFLAFLGLGDGRDRMAMARPRHWRAGNAFIHAFAREYGGDVVETAGAYLADDGRVRVLEGDRLFYFDDDHLSYHGTLLAKPVLREAIVRSRAAATGDPGGP